jgi:hypothetical protein
MGMIAPPVSWMMRSAIRWRAAISAAGLTSAWYACGKS